MKSTVCDCSVCEGDRTTFWQVSMVVVEQRTGTVNAPSDPSWAAEGWTAGPLKAGGLMKEMGPVPPHLPQSRTRPWSCWTGCCRYSGSDCRSWSWSRSCVLHPCCCDLCKKKRMRRRSGHHPGCCLHGCRARSCCCRRPGCPLNCHPRSAYGDRTRPGTSGWDC